MRLNEVKSLVTWAKSLNLAAKDIVDIRRARNLSNNRLLNYISACYSHGFIIPV